MRSIEEIRQAMLQNSEDEHIEFKEANSNYDFSKLVKYCCALANEGGGHLVLGVTDKKPRIICGSTAFENLERTKSGIFQRLHWRIEAWEVQAPEGRVVVFSVPGRPLGHPLNYEGAYWMRVGEELLPMSTERIREILSEQTTDFSAQICNGATISDLDADCVAQFRRLWHKKSRNDALLSCDDNGLLEDAELTIDGEVTYAALALLGTKKGLGRFLAQSEVIFEYRSSEQSIESQQRISYRSGFIGWLDALWETINLRNETQQYQDNLIRLDVPTFSEKSVREAILNAVSHRDYTNGGSVFVKQYPRKLEVISPGGFPPGITPETIIFKQHPRNRRIAEALEKCGLVERSGQGADRMFSESVREGKPLPDFSGTDSTTVFLTLDGQISDERFLRFLEKVGRDAVSSFSTRDFLVLDAIHRDVPINEAFKPQLNRLVQLGIVERVARGKLILSRQFHAFLDQKGAYTRKRGLDHETNKQLLLRHIRANTAEGSPMRDLLEVLPARSREQVKALLNELRQEGLVHVLGERRAALWFHGPDPSVKFGANLGEESETRPQTPPKANR